MMTSAATSVKSEWMFDIECLPFSNALKEITAEDPDRWHDGQF
jgi:hypothetical protein